MTKATKENMSTEKANREGSIVDLINSKEPGDEPEWFQDEERIMISEDSVVGSGWQWLLINVIKDNQEDGSITINFILKTNRQTAVCITNRASIYVMQSVMMDKKHNMNNNNNKS